MAGGDGAMVADGLEGGYPRSGEGGRLFYSEVRRFVNEMALVAHRVLGKGAVDGAKHLISGTEFAYRSADCLDDTGRVDACLAEAGFSKEASYHAYHVLEAHIVGYSLWLAGHDLTRVGQANVARRIERGIFAGYPRLLEPHEQHRVNGPHRRVNAFEVGLDLILKGLAHERL